MGRIRMASAELVYRGLKATLASRTSFNLDTEHFAAETGWFVVEARRFDVGARVILFKGRTATFECDAKLSLVAPVTEVRGGRFRVL